VRTRAATFVRRPIGLMLVSDLCGVLPMMRTPIFLLFMLAGLVAGCATSRPGVEVPDDALVVASVRHTAGPQPVGAWVARASLPADAQRSDGERALLFEVAMREGQVVSTESAPLELANLVVRVESRTRRETVVAIENAVDTALAFDLFVSPDGERFRRIPACPVDARGRSFERWPERAAWIAIGRLRAADASAANCGAD
jgi:hypothetical protein